MTSFRALTLRIACLMGAMNVYAQTYDLPDWPGGEFFVSARVTGRVVFEGVVPASPWMADKHPYDPFAVKSSTYFYPPSAAIVEKTSGRLVSYANFSVTSAMMFGGFSLHEKVSLGVIPPGDYQLQLQVGRRQWRVPGDGWYGAEATVSNVAHTSPVRIPLSIRIVHPADAAGSDGKYTLRAR